MEEVVVWLERSGELRKGGVYGEASQLGGGGVGGSIECAPVTFGTSAARRQKRAGRQVAQLLDKG